MSREEARNRTSRIPDDYVHTTDDWLVLPDEITGLSAEEIARHKPWLVPLLQRCRERHADP